MGRHGDGETRSSASPKLLVSQTPHLFRRCVLIKKDDQLLQDRFPLGSIIGRRRVRQTASEVVLKDELRHFGKCARRGTNLHDDIHARRSFLHHAIDGLGLSDDSPNPMVDSFFVVFAQHMAADFHPDSWPKTVV